MHDGDAVIYNVEKLLNKMNAQFCDQKIFLQKIRVSFQMNEIDEYKEILSKIHFE